MSFTNEFHASYTSLSNYVCEMKEKYNIHLSNSKMIIAKNVPYYSNILKKCMLRCMRNLRC